jgi:threonine dehydrogenase-like Zn-dependent dehydrogenase
VVGALVAWLCGQIPGAQVTLIDVEPSRAALARSLGVAFSAPESAPGDCDLVVHASGTGEGLSTALRLAGMEATVVEMSWYGRGEVPVRLGGTFHSRRLKLISSQVGQVAPSHRPRWTHKRRLAAALDLLRDTRLDALLAPAIEFADVPAKLPAILDASRNVLCQLVRYPAGPA